MSKIEENFDVVATNLHKGSSGFYYKIQTIKEKKYKFIINGSCKLGNKCAIICDNKLGKSYINKVYIDKKNDKIYKFDIIGDGSVINFGILFTAITTKSIVKINYMFVVDENNNILNIGNVTSYSKAKIYCNGNLGYVEIYKKILELNKKLYVALDYKKDINEKEILDLFDETYGKILIKDNCACGYYDQINKLIIVPLIGYEIYLATIDEDIYYFKY